MRPTVPLDDPMARPNIQLVAFYLISYNNEKTANLSISCHQSQAIKVPKFHWKRTGGIGERESVCACVRENEREGGRESETSASKGEKIEHSFQGDFSNNMNNSISDIQFLNREWEAFSPNFFGVGCGGDPKKVPEHFAPHGARPGSHNPWTTHQVTRLLSDFITSFRLKAFKKVTWSRKISGLLIIFQTRAKPELVTSSQYKLTLIWAMLSFPKVKEEIWVLVITGCTHFVFKLKI